MVWFADVILIFPPPGNRLSKKNPNIWALTFFSCNASKNYILTIFTKLFYHLVFKIKKITDQFALREKVFAYFLIHAIYWGIFPPNKQAFFQLA